MSTELTQLLRGVGHTLAQIIRDLEHCRDSKCKNNIVEPELGGLPS